MASMNPFFIVILLGLVQGLYIGFILIGKQKRNLNDKILGLFFIIISVAILNFLLRSLNVYKSYQLINRILLSELFLIGPVFYFYIRSLIHNDFTFSAKYAAHLIPFVTVLLINFVIVLFPELNNPVHKLVSFFQFVHVFIYIYVSSKNISKLEDEIRKALSFENKINFMLIKAMLFSLSLIFGLGVIFYFLWIFNIEIYHVDRIIIPVLITIVIFFVGYIYLRQPEIIYAENEIQKGKKYEKSALTKERSEEEFKKLLDLMEKEKPYLDNELSLVRLADISGISQHHLSQIINENMNQNFFDFVNKYRVDEAKIKLVSDAYKNYTIFAIALESGFNSKSAFNQALKKNTGETPTSFRKNTNNL